MSRGLVLGLVLSALLHGSLLVGFLQRTTAPQRVTASQDTVMSLAMFQPPPPVAPPIQRVEPLKPKPVVKKKKPKLKHKPSPKPKPEPKPEPVEEVVESVEQSQLTPVPAVSPAPVSKPVTTAAYDGDPVLVDKPVYVSRKSPRYPRRARARNYEGTVIFMLLISESGRVIDVEMLESSGHSSLDQSALKAVKQWRFQPATRGGAAVKSKAKAPVVFKLKG